MPTTPCARSSLTAGPGGKVARSHPQFPTSMRNAACSRRNAPSRTLSIPDVCPGPRNAPMFSFASAHVRKNGWSIRLRPTWSELFAAPDASRSFAFSTAWPAGTG